MDDLISRKAAIDAICKACSISDDYVECVERRPGSTFCDEIVALRKVPSAEPECNLDEWCHDCKEYDKEKNRCPRWNRVIRTALEEAQPERKKGQWCITYADSKLHGIRPFIRVCSSCASVSNHCYNYCPNCGARMEK